MVSCDLKKRKVIVTGDIRDVLDEIVHLLVVVTNELKNDERNVDNEISK